MRLWALPQAEDSLFITRKNTLRSNSSSLVRSTPGGGVPSSFASAPFAAGSAPGEAEAVPGTSADFLAHPPAALIAAVSRGKKARRANGDIGQCFRNGPPRSQTAKSNGEVKQRSQTPRAPVQPAPVLELIDLDEGTHYK